jgi:omega-amidase
VCCCAAGVCGCASRRLGARQYDIRFPQYAHLLRLAGAHLLLYPGAFNMTTGPIHWELLAKARAVDNQAFVAVPSPARNPSAGYQAWGHSSVVDPWGKVTDGARAPRVIGRVDRPPPPAAPGPPQHDTAHHHPLPHAQVVATTEHEEAIVYAEVDLAEVQVPRSSIPVFDQKRDDLYALKWTKY